jgi:hypothetical protein
VAWAGRSCCGGGGGGWTLVGLAEEGKRERV